MQDKEPSEATGAGDWLEQIRSQLGDRTETLKAAIEEVAATCTGPSNPVAWVDVRKNPRLTVYVLHERIVHVIAGERDQEPDQRNLDDSAETKCTWRMVPVTSGASCSMLVIRSVRTTGPASLTRLWGLRFGDENDEDLALAYPPRQDEYPRGPDPTLFARALMAEIKRAKAEASRARDGDA